MGRAEMPGLLFSLSRPSDVCRIWGILGVLAKAPFMFLQSNLGNQDNSHFRIVISSKSIIYCSAVWPPKLVSSRSTRSKSHTLDLMD